ncbi:hypothetical protein EV702DRAFT_1256380 [Suillus placidus]|uniref:Uncharacterized protein n=1 Tax=Suillus placidus TaxID=48579 RepID=A0A9P6ZJY0_9AGAM|nr:hypothetical protein EV702DRAFT_1256380 [Suillus placidus]
MVRTCHDEFFFMVAVGAKPPSTLLRCPHILHACMHDLLRPNLVCLRLASKEEEFWTHIMSSVVSDLSRYSLRLEVVELHATSPQVSELALCGLTHLQKVSLTLFSNNTLSCLGGLVGLQVSDIRIGGVFARVKSQFRTSSLEKSVVHSFGLALGGNLLEGWVVPCRRLQLTSEHSETAFVIERALCKLNNRVLFDHLECILRTQECGAYRLCIQSPYIHSPHALLRSAKGQSLAILYIVALR